MCRCAHAVSANMAHAPAYGTLVGKPDLPFQRLASTFLIKKYSFDRRLSHRIFVADYGFS